MNKTTRKALATAGALATLTMGAAIGATAVTTTTPDTTPEQVNISIEYGPNGEAETVSLTDANGMNVPVGGVSESWDADDEDAEE